MKQLKNIITEKLRLDKNIKRQQYTCQPLNRIELKDILKERLAKDKNANLNDIDVSKITSMSYLFDHHLKPHNIKIDKWNVSNVIDMNGMFIGCKNFNCDLSNWDVSYVQNMQSMFYFCKNFEGIGLENWNVSNVKYMSNMFYNCKSLKKIPDWYKVV